MFHEVPKHELPVHSNKHLVKFTFLKMQEQMNSPLFPSLFPRGIEPTNDQTFLMHYRGKKTSKWTAQTSYFQEFGSSSCSVTKCQNSPPIGDLHLRPVHHVARSTQKAFKESNFKVKPVMAVPTVEEETNAQWAFL
jgi:hypothetical protein